LVPEAYWQKLRSCKKWDDQTHVEFAREKELLFEKWLTSKEVTKNFDKQRQLILIEELKQDIKTYLDIVSSLVEASTMADDYKYVQYRSTSYNHFDKPKSGSWEKN